MHLNSLIDQWTYRIIRSELDTRLYEVTFAAREKFEDSEEIILNFGDLNPFVKEFITTFFKSFTKEQTKAMLSRIKTLTITEKIGTRSKFTTFISLGMYDNKENCITLEYYDDKKIPLNIKNTLSHELLHMASTRNTEVGVITGLEIPGVLGENFNEGCTEYFTMKYFTKEDYQSSEDDRILIVKGIENIVGSETLQACYFDANIGKLIQALEPYSDKENILKLFYMIDHLNDPFMARKNYRSIIREIARMNHRRLVKLKAEGKITQEEYDIEHAIKVDEYRYYQMWNEETEVIKDGDCFILKNRDRQSELYAFNFEENNPQFEKKYQE